MTARSLRQVTRAALALTVAALGLVAAGCGSPSAPAVAHLGAATTSAAAVSGAGSASPGERPADRAAFVAFVDCMQKHGVQAQLGQGGRGVSISGVTPGSPQLQTAQKACQKLLPGGGPQPLSPAQQAQQRRELVVLATCMRAHGFPKFPDPSSQGFFDLSGGQGFDPNSQQFQNAMNACRPKGQKGVPVRIGFRVGPS